jgi:hypothetical protein
MSGAEGRIVASDQEEHQMRKAGTATLVVLGAAATLAVGLAVAALAATNASSGTQAETSEETTETAKTTRYRAGLNATAEVPKPTGVPAGARGTFTVTLTTKGSSSSVAWTLTYRSLTGKVMAAHIHRGKPGKAGPVIVPLCGPCKTGQKGKAPVSKTVANAMKAGSAYVNLHTARNQAGEIRGQVKLA